MEVYLGLGINGSLLHVFGLIQQGNVELGYVGLSFLAVGLLHVAKTDMGGPSSSPILKGP